MLLFLLKNCQYWVEGIMTMVLRLKAQAFPHVNQNPI